MPGNCPHHGEIMATQTYVRDIASLRITDAEEAGGKGANLGELVAAQHRLVTFHDRKGRP
jgi:hypothetical protein